MIRNMPVLSLATAVVLVAGCSKPEPFRKATYPVTGQVYVDGQPAGGLQITLHDVSGMDRQHPTVSASITRDDGTFEISTYEQSDGVPAGEYALTFFWGELNVLSLQYGGPDKLNNRYDDPQKSTHRIEVQEGQPTDMGRIDLTTK